MPSVKSTFNFNTKKLILDDEEDYSGAVYPEGANAIGVNYTIVSPSGITIHNGTSTTDFDCYPLDETEFGSTNLPTDAANNILQGQYSVVKKIYYVDSSGDVVEYWKSASYTVNLNFTTPTAVVTPLINYYSPLLSATDNTNYTVNGVTYASINRLISIVHPNSLVPPVADVTATGNYVSTATFYGAEGGLQYAFKLYSVLTYDFTVLGVNADYSVVVTISDTEVEDIEVPDHVCKVFCVLAALEKRYQDAKCSNARELGQVQSKFLVASALAQLMRQAYLCGQISKVSVYKDAILSLGNANDDCCCGGDNGEPQLVVGIGGGSGTTIVQGVDGETVVTFDGSNTYTVGLSSEIIEILNGLSFNVTSTDGSITVTTTTEDGETTFDLAAMAGANVNRLDTEVLFTLTSVVLPIIVISNQQRTGTVFKDVTQDLPNQYVKVDPSITNQTEFNNSPVRFELGNFINTPPDDFFVESEIVGIIKDDVANNFPVDAVIHYHTNEKAYLMFRHADGGLLTGGWFGQNLNQGLLVKITFTS